MGFGFCTKEGVLCFCYLTSGDDADDDKRSRRCTEETKNKKAIKKDDAFSDLLRGLTALCVCCCLGCVA